jgi:hypothetical protein
MPSQAIDVRQEVIYSSAPHVVHGERTIVFRHRCLTGIIKVEKREPLSSRYGGECFTCVHLAGRGNWFDARCATDVSSTVGSISSHGIDELVNGAGMERDSQA